MIRMIRTLSVGALAVSLLAGGSAASAASFSEAIFSPEGRPLIETFDTAGSGDFDELNGAALQSSFRHPVSLTVAKNGAVLVADTKNHRLRNVGSGQVSVYAGIGVTVLFDNSGLPLGSLQDGAKSVSLFNQPMGIALDGSGNVYVADQGNHAIRKVAPNGNVTTLAGNGILGLKDGRGAEAAFHAPSDVAVASDGTVYVADTLNHVIRKISSNGEVTTLTAPSTRVVEVFPGVVTDGGDFADGAIAKAKFNEPMGLALDVKENLYVSDAGNQRIRYIDFTAGTVTTVAGGGDYAKGSLYVEGFNVDGAADEARFFNPRGLTVDANGGVYIADSLNHSIRYLKDGKVITVVGTNTSDYGSRNGIDGYARLDRPMDVALDAQGNLLISDTYNNKIRKVEYYTLPSGRTADGTIRVLNGKAAIAFDAHPEIRAGRTMVPVRAIAEALGFEVSFQGEDIILKGANRTVKLTLGKQEVVRTEGGSSFAKAIDAAPYVLDQRTYVPIRFFAEEIGMDVKWHAETTTVILRAPLK